MGSKGSVTDVKGSWTVPEVTSTQTTNSYSSFWVGIDGYSSNTVEQIGTDSDYVNGAPTYYAWFEFYPKQAYIISTVSVIPGDVMSAEVTYSKSTFTVSITNTRTHKSFSTSAKVPSARMSSAEWIAEAPSSGGVLPLANFGAVSFTSCSATIGSKTGSIGSFAPSSVYQISMVNSAGSVIAQPSSLSNDGTSFTVTRISTATSRK